LKNKLKRFEAVKGFENFFQPVMAQQFHLCGRWNSDYFLNDYPIVVELGCGKGEYTVEMAQHYPQKNFIGIDIKGSRMYVGAHQAIQMDLSNVAFCRTKIDFITNCFARNEVSEIWLTFSDPQPKKPNKRLTSRSFIERYKQILKPNGCIHLKTDSDLLFDYTMEQIELHNYTCQLSSQRVYEDQRLTTNESLWELLTIQTHYEQLFTNKGAQIKYCQFQIH